MELGSGIGLELYVAEATSFDRQQYLDITPSPLLSEYEEEYKTFHDEAVGYGWLCYIQLGEIK